MTRRQVGAFFTLDYGYDFLGRLASMTTPAGRIEYRYETGQGIVVRTLPNGIKTFTTYAPNGQLSEITHGLSTDPKGNKYRVLAQYSYRYRPDGLIEQIAEDSPTEQVVLTYGYDTSGRLIQATDSRGPAYAYTYDQVGNRLKAEATGQPPQTATYDWAGRLTGLNGIPTAHDPAGNLTSVTVGGEAMSYRYNADNQLAEAGDGKVKYRYDGEGRLIARAVGGAETTFIPDPLSSYWQPLVMQGQDGHRTLVVWEGEKPLMLIEDGRPLFLLHDHLGSVRLVSDAQGQVTQRPDDEPFGMPVDSRGAADFGPGFAGLFWDGEAKSYLTLARAYRPDLGRFTQIDPQRRVPGGLQKDFSIYVYSGEDPVNFVDRNGADRERAEAELADIESRIRDLVAQEVRYNFPNKNIPGYLMCWQWQDLVYDTLTRDGQKYHEWDIIPYAERGNIVDKSLHVLGAGDLNALSSDDFYKHFFVVVQSKSDPERLYKLDPWRQNPIRFEFGIPRDVKSGQAAKPVPFTPDSRRFVPGLFGNPLHSDAPTLPPVVAPQPASVTWHGAVVHTTGGTPYGATPVYRAIDHFNGQRTILSKAFAQADGSSSTDRRASELSPSPVGGVYLGGSGQSLEGIGLLDGIAQDANGNLVLVGQTGGEIKLPPLRLDDVVTVFRSVYLDGEGPTVTIDPDRKDPHGPNMNVINSKATEGTYVGWILFQADRLMKGYNLGEDNETRREVTSAVPGYAGVLDTTYFGGGHAGAAAKGGSWERFWIVPAAARRFAAAPQTLTVLDVPLRVRTQPMKWENGELVDDPKRAPSKGAAAFTQWFTANYDGIAAEQWLTPPPESGIDTPVPIFTELRRIALLTAIAENLRDQDVPLPFWMRDYGVKPVPYKGTTPSLTTTRSKDNRTVQIFGGVSLSPPTADVQAVTNASGVGKLPKAERVAAQATLDRSASLAQAVREQMPVAEPLLVKALAGRGTGYQAVALPGADTQALAPAILDETDLSIPIGGGEEIRLARRFNSFFDPSGPWGQGWALDLPRLDQVKIPEQRAAQGTVTFLLGHELVTPLNSTYARFARAAPVPELNGSRLLVPDRPGEFFGLGDARPDFLTVPTRVVIRKDGERWHFGEGGALVATERNGYRTVYERDANGRIKRILGLQGKQLAATIALAYDPASGRLQSATSQRQTGQTPRAGDQATVRYAYDADGRLSGVTGDEGRTGYRYAGSRVAAVTNQAPSTPKVQTPTEVTVRTFEYNPRGQLLAETNAAGTRTDYRVTTDTAGQSLAVVPGGAKETAESVRYDPAFRPLEARFADGTQATWSYPVDGGASVDLKQPDGATIRLTETADGTRRTLALDGRPPLIGQYDSAGRLTSLNDGNRLLLRQEWRPDGRLGLAADERSAVRANYDQDGLLTRLLQTPPQEQNLPQPKQWQATELDPAGRPRKIADYRGLEVAIDYDAAGDLVGIGTKRDGGQYGYQLTRDAAGRVAELKSSWGNQRYNYDGEGRLVRVDMDDSGVTASVEWNDGQLAKVRQFDGGELSVAYYPDGPLAGLPKQVVTPNALALKYQYDAANRLASVDVGSESRLKLGYDAKGRLASWAYAPAGR